MLLSNKACVFSIKAFDEIIKNESVNVTKLIESLIAGMLLGSYGYDNKLVAAGYLLNVVGNTSYTYEDISKLFGGDVASLLLTSRDNISINDLDDCENKVRKIVSGLPLRNIILICASKVVELESLEIHLSKEKNSEAIKNSKTFRELKTYYKSYAESIGTSYKGQLYTRLNEAIIRVFESLEPKKSYEPTSKYNPYDELVKLRDVVSHDNPYIVELSSCDGITDSSLRGLINDFFDGADLRIRAIDESQKTNKYESEFIESKSGISSFEKYLLLSSALKDDLMHKIIGNQKVIITQSGLYDALLYLKILLKKRLIKKADLKLYLDYYISDLEYLINASTIGYKDVHEFEKTNEYDSTLIESIERIMRSKGQSDELSLDSQEETIIIAGTLLPILDNPYILKKIVHKKNSENS